MQGTIYFITGNANKFREIKSMLPDVKQLDLDLPEIQELDAEEIVKAKLLEAKKRKKGSFIIEDTSLYIKSLKGLPGPLIKWFLQSLGNNGLADLAMKHGNRSATAKTIVGYCGADGRIMFFSGVVHGKIVKPRGKTSFGWDPIFLPNGYKKTFAELDADIKNKISMRRKAINKLIKYLKNQI
ncbi:MAG: non-canonical purine NTP pyrophosphatase [Patescibacteria group bacterium]